MKTVNVLAIVLLFVCTAVTFSQTNYYVNPTTGDDTWDGLAPTYESGLRGPKKTIQNTVQTASANDTIHLASDVYPENPSINKTLVFDCAGAMSMEGLTITNASQVTLISSIQVTGTLSVGNGTIIGGPEATIEVTDNSPSAVAITGGRIIGKVLRTIAAGSTQPYPFTDANTELIPDGTQSTTEVYVQAFNQIPDGITPPEQVAINRYYVIFFNETGASLNAAFRMAYLESELNGINESSLKPFRWNVGDTHWSEGSGTVNAAANYYQTGTVLLTTWVAWTLGDQDHPLPIQLASFNAALVNGNDVQLSWRTLSETNNYGFYIQQRNLPSEVYVDVPNSFVPGHGTTIEPHDYSWTHVGVAPGTYDYRLKQVDLDGSVSFSDARRVIVSSLSGVPENGPAVFHLAQNYPNPFNPSTQIRFSVDRTAHTTLTVFDVLGREVATLFTGTAEAGMTYTLNFDASQMTNGTYFCRLVNGNQTSLRKMLLVK